MPKRQDWMLESAETSRAESPRSVFIATDAERGALRWGDIVVLTFVSVPVQFGVESVKESLRVRIVDSSVGQRSVTRWFDGSLLESPEYIDSLHAGDVVRFEDEHVFAVWQEVAPEGTLGTTCLVDARLVDDLHNESPEFAQRVVPENALDSGWRVSLGTPAAEVVERDWVWMRHRFPELAELPTLSGVGAAWQRINDGWFAGPPTLPME